MEHVKLMIEKMVEVHYGIRPGLLSTDLIKLSVKTIVQKFKTITISDIQHAFERVEIQRDDNWRNITKQQIIDPIQMWWNNKEFIRVEFETFKADQEIKIKSQQRKEKFRMESKELYNCCVESGDWLGTIFQSATIAKEIAQKIDQTRKDELYQKAKTIKKEQQREENAIKELRGKLDISLVGYTTIRIYADLIVKEGIRLKIIL